MAGYVWVAVCHDQVTNVQFWPTAAKSTKTSRSIADQRERKSINIGPLAPWKPPRMPPPRADDGSGMISSAPANAKAVNATIFRDIAVSRW